MVLDYIESAGLLNFYREDTDKERGAAEKRETKRSARTNRKTGKNRKWKRLLFAKESLGNSPIR